VTDREPSPLPVDEAERVPSAGSLVVVATPIGNLSDLSARAAAALTEADVVCCEDTRHTGRLLATLGLRARRLVSLHAHNEAARIEEVLALLGEGATVALVSDAGTPLVSDPGERLVAAAIGAGFEARSVPGASAVLAALVVSGFDVGHWRFEGFLPRKGRERRDRLALVAASAEPSVIYEAPSRLGATILELSLACGPERTVAVARELTKLHEEIWRGPLGDAAGSHAVAIARGEYVLVVAGAPERPAGSGVDLERSLAALLDAGLKRRDAVAAVEALRGVPHRDAYAAALGLGLPDAMDRSGPGEAPPTAARGPSGATSTPGNL
jgi:16S rRNA (cytidine1402-2'-O)-methyltransferase